MHLPRSLASLPLVALLAVGGCGSDDTTDTTKKPDGSTDAIADVGSASDGSADKNAPDTAGDASSDTAAPDGGADVTPADGTDASADGGADAGADTAPDAGADTTPDDGGGEAG